MVQIHSQNSFISKGNHSVAEINCEHGNACSKEGDDYILVVSQKRFFILNHSIPLLTGFVDI